MDIVYDILVVDMVVYDMQVWCVCVCIFVFGSPYEVMTLGTVLQ